MRCADEATGIRGWLSPLGDHAPVFHARRRGRICLLSKETYFYESLAEISASDIRPIAARQFLDRFLAGYLGKVPGLDVAPIARKAITQCKSTSEFLPRLMTAIVEQQGMERWIEGTPVHVLCMDQIARAVPDALFVHVIRDGRDCALSTDRQGWAHSLPWDAPRRVGVAALLWEWMVKSGRRYGRAYPQTYLEVRFEQLIGDPRAVLADGRTLHRSRSRAWTASRPIPFMR